MILAPGSAPMATFPPTFFPPCWWAYVLLALELTCRLCPGLDMLEGLDCDKARLLFFPTWKTPVKPYSDTRARWGRTHRWHVSPEKGKACTVMFVLLLLCGTRVSILNGRENENVSGVPWWCPSHPRGKVEWRGTLKSASQMYRLQVSGVRMKASGERPGPPGRI